MLARLDSDLRIRIEMLEEENRQLRERIARLTGKQDVCAARMTFGLTEAEARLFVALVHCGLCEYDQLQSAIYSDDDLMNMENPAWAIRTHVKRIRRKTRPHGIDFTTIYSLGFEMPDHARGKARAMMSRTRFPENNQMQDVA